MSRAWLVVLGWWILRYSEARMLQRSHYFDVIQRKQMKQILTNPGSEFAGCSKMLDRQSAGG